MIEVLFFAGLRERLGTGRALLEWTPDLRDVSAVRARLAQGDRAWEEALGAGEQVLAAVNEELAQPVTPVQDGDVVAFFPPVTGG